MGHDSYAEHLTPSNPQVAPSNIRLTVGVHHAIRAHSCALLLLLAVLSAIPAALAQNTIHIPADQSTIQAGINAAHNGDTVLVSPGTYYENINFNGKAITVTSSVGPANTIIDGGGNPAPVVTFSSGETRASILSNLTIRNGGATPGTVGIASWGGIFTGLDSNPSILNNLIMQNACNGYFGSGGALLQGNTISGTLPPSTAGCSYGEDAAVFLKGSSTTLPVVQVIGNIIENNVHPLASSGAITINGYIGAIVENNIIRNNAMTGIYAVNSNSMIIAQNLVYGNTSGLSAGIPFSGIGPPVGPPIGIIANNTFVQNSGSQVSLGGDLSQFDFVNNIVVGSGSAAPFLCGYPPADSLSLTPIVIDHNDIYNASGPAYGPGCPDQTGTYGNLSANPLFTNPATADFHLSPGSPAIDTGNNSVSPLLAKDLDGNPRPQDATGNGYPVVDMGAYESPGQLDANATSLTLTPSSYQPAGGSTITLTARLLSASGVPTGSVTFLEDNQQIGVSVVDSTGTATFPASGLVPGIHAFTATYSGQGSFKPAVSVEFFVLVGGYTVSLNLASTPNPSTIGQSVAFTVTITSGDGTFPTQLTLTDNGSSLGPGSTIPYANGVTVFTTSFTTLGSHTITVTYPGDTSHNSASASVVQQVVVNIYPTTTTLTVNPTSANVGQSVAFSAAVTGASTTSTGTVTFYDGTTLLGNVALDTTSHAAYSTTTLAAGTHTITASYAGDASYSSSTSAPVTITITAAPQDFSLALASPKLTIQTGQHLTTTATLASINSFADNLALTCANLPAHLTCTFTPNKATLTASATTTVSLTLDTASPTSASNQSRTSHLTLALLLSPATLFFGIGTFRKRRTPLRLLLLLLALLPMTLTLGGCGVVTIPTVPRLSSVAPGTYTIPITATGAGTGLTHTTQLTLTVTP
jgi:parallel beta-helix repeat protein